MTLVNIYVTAANENAPKFLQKNYIANLVENTPIGSPVITVSAFDNDEVNWHWTFSQIYE